VPLVCVIPARLGASRLPEKPLRLFAGEPLVRVVARHALALDLGGPVVVASDDERVLEAVAPLGIAALLTRGDHGSGTERVAEVIDRPEFATADVVLNLQGDEPFLPRAAALGAVQRVRAGDDVGTAAQPLHQGAWRDPHRVKVELDGRGRALSFYRTPPARACRPRGPTLQHVGVYAYSPASLRRWVALPPTIEERTERLEQLRPLRHGFRIGVAALTEVVPHGIDTEDDLRMAEVRQ
jgi:3-deoxy-manno-octulosonate cytidylyltransferase (CMP-KDO synthetase)